MYLTKSFFHFFSINKENKSHDVSGDVKKVCSVDSRKGDRCGLHEAQKDVQSTGKVFCRTRPMAHAQRHILELLLEFL